MKGVIAVVLLGLLSSLLHAERLRPDLAGTVVDAAGKPVEDAIVFVWTAGPKVGTSSYCPSCYPDCIKRATTDAEGRFSIPSLDPELVFRLLVARSGFSPAYVNRVDPTNGPVRSVLSPLDVDALPSNQKLSGRVSDPNGDPVFGAAVHFSSYRDDQGRGCGGQCDGFALVAVTDKKGRFTLTADRPFSVMSVEVEARGYARMHHNDLANTSSHDLKLIEGVTVKGRLMRGQLAVPGASIGLVSEDRSMESFTGSFTIGTDAEGRFLFPNLPPDRTYLVYSTMKEAARLGGVAPAKTLAVGANKTTKDLGDLRIQPAHRIRGRFVTSDGSLIPPKTRMLVSLDRAWDSLTDLEVAPDGSFEATGVPAGSIGIGISLRGYHLSRKNPSLDQMNGFSLVGTLDRDIDRIQILVEPGPIERFDSSKRGFTPDLMPKDKPLRGTKAEDLPASAKEAVVR
jgi:protocatechuate 3,4-dioxygenase beta subunit